MPDLTQNMGLKKPLDNETADIGVINENMDIIDSLAGIGRTAETVKKNADDIESLYAGITELGSDVELQKADFTQQIPFAVAIGTANSYEISTTPKLTNLKAGVAVSVKINIDSIGMSTLNWDGTGVKTIKKPNGNNVTNLRANGVYTFRYDGSNFILQGEGGEYGTAIPDKVLSGYSIGTEDGIVNGSMPNVGKKNIIPTIEDQYIQEGYHNGQGKVTGDYNLNSGNIKAGVSIFGVTGNVKEGTPVQDLFYDYRNAGGGRLSGLSSSTTYTTDVELKSDGVIVAFGVDAQDGYREFERSVKLKIDGVTIATDYGTDFHETDLKGKVKKSAGTYKVEFETIAHSGSCNFYYHQVFGVGVSEV